MGTASQEFSRCVSCTYAIILMIKIRLNSQDHSGIKPFGNKKLSPVINCG